MYFDNIQYLKVMGYILIFVGLFFIFSSIVGMYRFKDFYLKVHAAGVADSFGIPLSLIGWAFLQYKTINSVKIILMAILIFIVFPTSTHALAKSFNVKTIKKE